MTHDDVKEYKGFGNEDSDKKDFAESEALNYIQEYIRVEKLLEDYTCCVQRHSSHLD